MQGDRGRIYFWSKLRHADLNSKEWIRTWERKSLGVCSSRVIIFILRSMNLYRIVQQSSTFAFCCVERGRKSEEKRKRRGGGMFSFVRWNGKKEMRRETFVSIKL